MPRDEETLKNLFLRANRGDEVAYQQFLTGMSTLMRSFVERKLVRIGRGTADAEDIVQEVLLALHARRHAYDVDVPITAWAHAIARYKLIDYLRRTNSWSQVLPLDELDEQHDRYLDKANVSLTLSQVMGRLPEKLRRCIQVAKIEGLSTKEAAAAVGLSEAAVKVNVHRGLKALAKVLK